MSQPLRAIAVENIVSNFESSTGTTRTLLERWNVTFGSATISAAI